MNRSVDRRRALSAEAGEDVEETLYPAAAGTALSDLVLGNDLVEAVDVITAFALAHKQPQPGRVTSKVQVVDCFRALERL